MAYWIDFFLERKCKKFIISIVFGWGSSAADSAASLDAAQYVKSVRFADLNDASPCQNSDCVALL